MSKLTLGSVVLVVGTIAMTGRTRPAIAQATATPIDACALLTVQEASGALGGNVTAPKPGRTTSSTLGPGMPTAVSVCTFDNGKRHITIGVRHTLDSAAAGLRQMIQVVCQRKQPITGVGEQACWYNAEHGELQAVKGATFLTIEASIGPDIGAGLIDVAKKAFARVK